MPSPTVTLRLPETLKTALQAEAKQTGQTVSALILAKLSGPPTTIEVSPRGRQVEVKPETSLEELQRRGLIHVVKPPSAEAIAERDRRHVSPLIAPVRTEPRDGFEVAESDCEHPKENRQHLDYMTRCKRCGRRIS